MTTLFSKIITGEIPSHKISEDEHYIAFMDINPINPGHVLVVPKKEVDRLFDLEDSLLAGLILFAKKIVPAIESAIPCKRVGVMVAGLEVPHAHLHLIPMMAEGDLTFARAKPAHPAELTQIAQKIKNFLETEK